MISVAHVFLTSLFKWLLVQCFYILTCKLRVMISRVPIKSGYFRASSGEGFQSEEDVKRPPGRAAGAELYMTAPIYV